MTFDAFKTSVSKIIGRLGFSAEFNESDGNYTALVSDGTVITGSVHGFSITISLCGKTIRTDTNHLA